MLFFILENIFIAQIGLVILSHYKRKDKKYFFATMWL